MKTRPNCKVGDTLRVDSDEWSSVYPRGSEGVVAEVNKEAIWVRVTKTPNSHHVGASSGWWTRSSTDDDGYRQATLTVLVEVTDEEVEAARTALKELLYG